MPKNLARFTVALRIDTGKFGKSTTQLKKSMTDFVNAIDSRGKVEVIPNPAALREINARLKKLSESTTGSILRVAANKGIQPAAKKARATIPKGKFAHKTYKGNTVAPGFASRSIRVQTRLSRDKQSALAQLGVLPEAFYATQFVELGTSRQRAQPWLVPSFESTVKEQQSSVAESLKKSLEKAAKF